MNDQPQVEKPAKAMDFMDWLVMAVADRVKDKLMEDIMKTINENLPSIHVDAIEGLEEYVGNAIEQDHREGNFKIDADDVEGLDEYIKETLKKAHVSFDF